jgi:hypothetical protein
VVQLVPKNNARLHLVAYNLPDRVDLNVSSDDVSNDNWSFDKHLTKLMVIFQSLEEHPRHPQLTH